MQASTGAYRGNFLVLQSISSQGFVVQASVPFGTPGSATRFKFTPDGTWWNADCTQRALVGGTNSVFPQVRQGLGPIFLARPAKRVYDPFKPGRH